MNSSIFVCAVCNKANYNMSFLECCNSLICSTCSLDKKSIRCPKCENLMDTNANDKTPDAFLQKYLMIKESISSRINKEIELCERCEKSSFENIYCVECQKNLCISCDNIIHEVGRYKIHKRTRKTKKNCSNNFQSENDVNLYCAEHNQQLAIGICCKDNKLLCAQCQNSHLKTSCKSSNILSIKDAHEKMLNYFMFKSESFFNSENYLKELQIQCKTSIEEFKKEGDAFEKKIKDYFKEFHEILYFQEKQSLNQLKFVLKSHLENIYSEVDSINSLSLQINEINDLFYFILHRKNYDYLQALPFISDKIQEISNLLLDLQKNPKEIKKLQLDTSNFGEFKALLIQNNFKIFTSNPKEERKIAINSNNNNNNEKSDKKYANERSFTPRTIRSPSSSYICKEFKEFFGGFDPTKNKTYLPKERKNSSHAQISQQNSLSTININLEENNVNENKNKAAPLTEEVNNSTRNRNASPFIKKQENKANFYGNSGRSCSIKIKEKKIKPSESEVFSKQANQRNIFSDFTESVKSYDICSLSEMMNNPLIKRVFLKKLSSSHSIHVSWTHCPQWLPNHIGYILEYGIGSKLGGIEQFRKCYQGSSNFFTLNDLQPKTNYRLRVCPMQEKTVKDKENHSIIPYENTHKGEWSEVISISTLDIPIIDQKTCGQHATFIVKDSENIVTFNKSGIITGTNPFIFGTCIFEVKLELQAAHHSADDVSCIKIGITNKSGKIWNIIGSTINYGLNRNVIIVKGEFDVEASVLKIYNSNCPECEVFNNIQNGPWYPAFQNKTAKNTNTQLQISVNFY